MAGAEGRGSDSVAGCLVNVNNLFGPLTNMCLRVMIRKNGVNRICDVIGKQK